MRRIALLFGILMVLLIGSGGALALRRAQDDLAPAGAVNLRLSYRSGELLFVSYSLPPDWILLDLYAHLSARGWTRDQDAERGLRQGSFALPNTTYAIFTRERWFGLGQDITIVGLPAARGQPVFVRQIRCLAIGGQERCS
jgi:hypothetical protein